VAINTQERRMDEARETTDASDASRAYDIFCKKQDDCVEVVLKPNG
jgi:hypothetical protein